MNGEDFEKQDAFIRENLKAMRPKEVPEPVLRGFREGVEKKIKSGAVQPLRMGFPPQAACAGSCLRTFLLFEAVSPGNNSAGRRQGSASRLSSGVRSGSAGISRESARGLRGAPGI